MYASSNRPVQPSGGMGLILGFALLGVYKASSEGVFKAYVVDSVSEDRRGSALGAFHTGVGVVMLPGGIAAGLLWDSVGSHATFLYGAIVALMSIILLSALGPGRKAQ